MLQWESAATQSAKCLVNNMLTLFIYSVACVQRNIITDNDSIWDSAALSLNVVNHFEPFKTKDQSVSILQDERGVHLMQLQLSQQRILHLGEQRRRQTPTLTIARLVLADRSKNTVTVQPRLMQVNLPSARKSHRTHQNRKRSGVTDGTSAEPVMLYAWDSFEGSC